MANGLTVAGSSDDDGIAGDVLHTGELSCKWELGPSCGYRVSSDNPHEGLLYQQGTNSTYQHISIASIYFATTIKKSIYEGAMSNIRTRFEEVRTAFNVSKRALSIELGLSPSAWAAYEGGKATPSFEVLAALHARGIDLNWLFTGVGSMKIERHTSELGFVQEAEQRFLAGLRIGKMVLGSSYGTVVKRSLGLDVIMAADKNGITLPEINEAVGMDFAPLLMQLVEEDIVTSWIENGVERFAVSEEVALTRAGEQDKAQAGIEVMDFLARKIIPAAHAKPARGMYLKANVHVKDPTAFVREIQRFLSEKASSLPNTRTDTKLVTILFGACVE